jgi:hypothetical protein
VLCPYKGRKRTAAPDARRRQRGSAQARFIARLRAMEGSCLCHRKEAAAERFKETITLALGVDFEIEV